MGAATVVGNWLPENNANPDKSGRPASQPDSIKMPIQIKVKPTQGTVQLRPKLRRPPERCERVTQSVRRTGGLKDTTVEVKSANRYDFGRPLRFDLIRSETMCSEFEIRIIRNRELSWTIVVENTYFYIKEVLFSYIIILGKKNRWKQLNWIANR